MEKVYKLVIGDFYYYGQTKCSLEERLRTHHNDFKRLNTKLYNKIRELGWENVRIELVEECENSREIENKLIKESLDDDFCLNTRRSFNTDEDIRNYRIEHYYSNIDKIKEYSKNTMR